MKKRILNPIFSFFLIILVCSGVSHGKDIFELKEDSSGIDLYLFHSEECRACQSVIPALTSKLKAMYPLLNIHLLDLKDPENYEALKKFENTLGRRGEELPLAVIGNHLLSGEKELSEKLDSCILEYTLGPPTRKPIYDLPPLPPPPGKNISIEIIYFRQSGCAKCGRTDILLDYLKQKYQGLSVKTIDLSSPEGKLMAEAIAEKVNLPEKFRLIAPAILIGKTFFPPPEISDEKIEEALLNPKKLLPPPLIIDRDETKKAEKSIIERFKALTPLPVALGGLIDGVNPCAFATLIFLISYLSMIGSKKENILKIGLGFTASVFLTYFLIGIGLISFIRHLSPASLFSRGIYLLSAVFALVMGAISFYDFLLWKKGREREIKLQLPKPLKRLTHQTIRRLDLSKYQLPGAVLLGFAVSLFEFTCTGQVYLPTIVFMTGISGFQKDAILYLAIYNLAFIIPLLSVFTLFYFGVSQWRLSAFLHQRGVLVKLLTSFFFFFLGTAMVFTAI